jgi:hypothetical protein
MSSRTRTLEKIRHLIHLPPTQGITLSPEDLQEFTLRRATLNNAKFQALMVEEAFQMWSKNLRAKYGLPVKFEIDPVTGKVTAKD